MFWIERGKAAIRTIKDEASSVQAMKAGTLDYLVKSEAVLSDLPHIAERALREWSHIANRKKAEEALRKSQQSLLVAQKIAHFGTFERDFRTGKGWLSDEIYRLLGVSPDEDDPLIENFLEYVHPEDVEGLKESHSEIASRTCCCG